MDLTLPSLLLGLMIGALMGAGFHLLRGGSLGRLLLYLILGIGGFWAGHFAGDYFGISFGEIGALNIGAGIAGGIVLLVIGYWLSLVQGSNNHRS